MVSGIFQTKVNPTEIDKIACHRCVSLSIIQFVMSVIHKYLYFTLFQAGIYVSNSSFK